MSADRRIDRGFVPSQEAFISVHLRQSTATCCYRSLPHIGAIYLYHKIDITKQSQMPCKYMLQCLHGTPTVQSIERVRNLALL